MKPQDWQTHFCAVVGVVLIGANSTLPEVGMDRAPFEERSPPGVETVPRQAATVILLRGGADALEVLLVKRSSSARWMAGVWVFPGGAVDPAEAASAGDPASDDLAHRAAAVRELAEEA